MEQALQQKQINGFNAIHLNVIQSIVLAEVIRVEIKVVDGHSNALALTRLNLVVIHITEYEVLA